MKLNILYLSPSSEIGGAERSLLLILDQLDKDRFTPIVLLPPKGPLNKLIEERNIKVINLPRKWIEAHSFLELAIFAPLVAIICKLNHISIIHSNSKFCFRLAMWVHIHTWIKLIQHWRDFSLWYDELRLLKRWGRTIKVIAVSEAVKTFLQTEVSIGLPITVIYDSIDPAYLVDYHAEREPLRHELGLDSKLTLAITGRIDSWKGHKILLKALNQLNNDNLHLLICGAYHLINNPLLKEELLALLTDYNLATKVTFLGFRNDLPRLLSAVDIVVVPSDFEPLGMVVLEAMAAGKPVIGSRTGGIEETLVHEQTGLLFQASKAEALAQAINDLASHPEQLETMGQAGKKRYLEFFGENLFKDKINTLYLSFIK